MRVENHVASSEASPPARASPKKFFPKTISVGNGMTSAGSASAEEPARGWQKRPNSGSARRSSTQHFSSAVRHAASPRPSG